MEVAPPQSAKVDDAPMGVDETPEAGDGANAASVADGLPQDENITPMKTPRVQSAKGSRGKKTFAVGERVKARDAAAEPWRKGTVVEVAPLTVKPDGWDKPFSFKHVLRIVEKQPPVSTHVSKDETPAVAETLAEPEAPSTTSSSTVDAEKDSNQAARDSKEVSASEAADSAEKESHSETKDVPGHTADVVMPQLDETPPAQVVSNDDDNMDEEVEKTPAKKRRKQDKPKDSEDAPQKKQRKKKVEGPYAKYKEWGVIPEPVVERCTTAVPDGRTGVKLMAWNVGGLRAFLQKRVHDLADMVDKEKPDFLGFLEHKLQSDGAEESIKTLEERLPDYKVAKVNYSTVKKGYSGAALLLRRTSPEPINVTAWDLPCTPDEGRLITAEYDTFFAILCYVPNSGDGLVRLSHRIDKWDAELRDHLSELAKTKAVVLIGDLNVAHRDVDIWNAEAPHIPKSAGTTTEERESFSKLLEAGFVDGFANFNESVLGAFTYWSVRAKGRPANRGLRLDYVVTSKNMLEALDSTPMILDVFHLPDLCTGDHCPVGAEIAI